MSSDFSFTAKSRFLGNVRVKPFFNTQWGGGADFGRSGNPNSAAASGWAGWALAHP